MSGPRDALAAALTAAAPAGVSVYAQEPNAPPAAPAFVIRPGLPYRAASILPYCLETWRLEIVALAAIDRVDPLDQLDELVAIARDVVNATPQAKYNGIRLAPAVEPISGKSFHAAVVELDVDV